MQTVFHFFPTFASAIAGEADDDEGYEVVATGGRRGKVCFIHFLFYSFFKQFSRSLTIRILLPAATLNLSCFVLIFVVKYHEFAKMCSTIYCWDMLGFVGFNIIFVYVNILLCSVRSADFRQRAASSWRKRSNYWSTRRPRKPSAIKGLTWGDLRCLKSLRRFFKRTRLVADLGWNTGWPHALPSDGAADSSAPWYFQSQRFANSEAV